MKTALNGFLLLLAMLAAGPLFAVEGLQETPSLLARVQSGELPPVEQRVPEQPAVVQLDGDSVPGKHGGQLRLLMGKQKDIRQMVRIICLTGILFMEFLYDHSPPCGAFPFFKIFSTGFGIQLAPHEMLII